MKARMKVDLDVTSRSPGHRRVAGARVVARVALAVLALALSAIVVLAGLSAHAAHAREASAATLALITALCALALAAGIVAARAAVAASRTPALTASTTKRDEARMMGIIRSSTEAIITIDEAQNIVIFNPAAERIFGVPAAQALGTPLSRFIPARFREMHAQHVAHFGVTGTSERQMGRQPVLSGLRANGDEFPLEASIAQNREDAGKFYTVMLRDITERVKSDEALRQSREELRRLSANLQNVREAEKTRIARELHDDLGQQLAALKMDLSALEPMLTGSAHVSGTVGPDIAARLRGMLGMIDSTVASLRRIAADLRPVMLDDLGLVPAIDWLANDFTNRYGIEVGRRIDADNAAFTQDAATAVFRIVQEALTNVARHADASFVELTLCRTEQHYVLRIADNGLGASRHTTERTVANAREVQPFGLIGVRERAHMLGGSVQIDTGSGAGFAMTVTFPLQAAQQDNPHP
jgi:PAS domain S-box-containing protein